MLTTYGYSRQSSYKPISYVVRSTIGNDSTSARRRPLNNQEQCLKQFMPVNTAAHRQEKLTGIKSKLQFETVNICFIHLFGYPAASV